MKKVFHFFASIRFAIPLMIVFAASLIAGTLLESKYGAQFAARKVYFTWWFFCLLGGIAVSVTFSLIERLPFKKRLLGFYIVHTGIVVIVVGAVVTRLTGVDGTMQLTPGKPNGTVLYGDDFLYVNNGSSEYKFKLPFTAARTALGDTLGAFGSYRIRVLDYLPYARERLEWVKGGRAWSSRWMVKNAMFAETVNVADRPLTDHSTSVRMGPLTLKVVSGALLDAFEAALKRKDAKAFLVYDRVHDRAYPVRKFPFSQRLVNGNLLELSRQVIHGGDMTIYTASTADGVFRFFPQFSSHPVERDLSVQSDAPIEFFDPALFADGPTVLVSRDLQGVIHLGFGKGKDWNFAWYRGGPLQLPWMGIELTLLGERVGEKPRLVYDEAKPDKDDANNTRAALIEIMGPGVNEHAWLSNRREFNFDAGELTLGGLISSQIETLPWRLTLEEFKMDKIPGTEEAASYESFVKVGADEKLAHIFMNNPLKKGGYTFYQSSYFQDEEGRYNTVLAVNRDPGRAIKYAGSLILVFGMILHFLILHGIVRIGRKPEAPIKSDERTAVSKVALGGER